LVWSEDHRDVITAPRIQGAKLKSRGGGPDVPPSPREINRP